MYLDALHDGEGQTTDPDRCPRAADGGWLHPTGGPVCPSAPQEFTGRRCWGTGDTPEQCRATCSALTHPQLGAAAHSALLGPSCWPFPVLWRTTALCGVRLGAAVSSRGFPGRFTRGQHMVHLILQMYGLFPQRRITTTRGYRAFLQMLVTEPDLDSPVRARLREQRGPGVGVRLRQPPPSPA